MPISVTACAFGQQSTKTSGPSNKLLGSAVFATAKLVDVRIATQWKINVYLQTVDWLANKVVAANTINGH